MDKKKDIQNKETLRSIRQTCTKDNRWTDRQMDGQKERYTEQRDIKIN